MIPSHARSVRWLPALNADDEDIPPYALVTNFSPGSAYELVDNGERVVCVYKPSKFIVPRQDHSRFFAVGPNGIRKGKRGVVSQDWPLQVLVDEDSENDVTVADAGTGFLGPCGPKIDSFGVSRDGFCFSSQGTDLTCIRDANNAVLPAAKRDKPRCWIVPNLPQQNFVAGGITVPATAAGGRIPVTIAGNLLVSLNYRSIINSTRFPDWEAKRVDENNEYPDTLVVPFDGVYLFGFHATVYSNEAPRGGRLAMALYVNDDGSIWEGSRTQDVEVDHYGNDIHRSQENVSVTGLVELRKDDEVYIKNDGSYATWYVDFRFWLLRAAALPSLQA